MELGMRTGMYWFSTVPHLSPIHPQPQITCPSLDTQDTPTSLPAVYMPQVHTPHLSHSSLLAFGSPSTPLRFPEPGGAGGSCKNN